MCLVKERLVGIALGVDVEGGGWSREKGEEEEGYTRVGEIGFVAAGGVGDVFGGVLHLSDVCACFCVSGRVRFDKQF